MEVGWASDHGLPHSALLGWDPVDRAKLVAYLLESAEKCSGCGTAMHEWEPELGGRKDAYEPAIHQCWGCYHRENASRDIDLPAGARVTLIPREIAERTRRARSD